MAGIPTYDSLASVYAVPSEQESRYAELSSAFSTAYGIKPDCIARAPGRVNIIGEHIDYSSFSVLPTAIEKDVLIAFSTSASTSSKSRFELRNMNQKYRPHTFEIDGLSAEAVEVDASELRWENYFKAACKGMLQHLSKQQATPSPVHVKMLFTGSVPSGGGLSSSAAMCVASCITVAQAIGALTDLSKEELTEIAIESERLVGVQAGGMDQSASVLSEKGSLLHVEFHPKLHAVPVALPAGEAKLVFVIANSLVVNDKHVTAKHQYNLRVVECRLASFLLARHLKFLEEHSTTLKQILDQSSPVKGSSESPAEVIDRLQSLLYIVEKQFNQYANGLSWEEVYALCGDGMDQEHFKRKFHPNFEIEADKVHIYKRSKHVLAEAARVYQARQLLENASSNTNTAEELGQLMSASHTSCRDDYECSCTELDQLVQLAMDNGSLGARLTGAGWGGCSVSLWTAEKADQFLKTLRKEYYAKQSDEEYRTACFITEPESGACLLKF